MKVKNDLVKFIDENYRESPLDYDELMNDEIVLLSYEETQKKDLNIVDSNIRSEENESSLPLFTNNIITEKLQKSNLDYMMENKEKWYIGGIIDEWEFIKIYIAHHPMIFYLKQFYDINDIVNRKTVENDILEILSLVVKSNQLKNSTKNILSFLETKCFIESYKPADNTIHTKNTTLFIDNESNIIVKPKEITINRFNVEYIESASQPSLWLNLLNQLLEEKDITILQEYLGYCLLATTQAQKSLFIIGKTGGEGKSTILRIVKELFGQNCIIEKSLKKMLTNQFGFYGINNKVLVYDDETDPLENKMIEPLKKFISNDEISYEAKYENEIKLNHYAKFISLGNNLFENIRTDDTALIRRLIILEVKSVKRRNIINQDKLLKEIKQEYSAIFNWCITGLLRLIKNNYTFSYSDEMLARVSSIISNNSIDYIEEFLNDENHILLKENNAETSIDLYNAYIIRCNELEKELVNKKRFFTDLMEISKKYNLEYSEKLYPSERRGYKNIKIVNTCPF